MWSFSSNSRKKLRSQPLSRPASSLCPCSWQRPSAASLQHSSGNSRRNAQLLQTAMVPRGPPPQLRTADALPISAFARTEWGPRESLYEAVSRGIYAAGMPCGRETLAAPHSACSHSSFAPLLLHGSHFLWESKCKFSIACPWCQVFPSFPACPEVAKLCKIATQMHFRIHIYM